MMHFSDCRWDNNSRSSQEVQEQATFDTPESVSESNSKAIGSEGVYAVDRGRNTLSYGLNVSRSTWMTSKLLQMFLFTLFEGI